MIFDDLYEIVQRSGFTPYLMADLKPYGFFYDKGSFYWKGDRKVLKTEKDGAIRFFNAFFLWCSGFTIGVMDFKCSRNGKLEFLFKIKEYKNAGSD